LIKGIIQQGKPCNPSQKATGADAEHRGMTPFLSSSSQPLQASCSSSAITLVTGAQLDFSGELEIGSNLKISYVPQGTDHLHGTLEDYAELLGIDETLFKTILRKLDFDRAQFDKDIADFSEGQKKKVLLAGSLSEEAHLYVWDEPLNFIDILSHRQIEDLILLSKPTILFVEHNSDFISHIATKQVHFT
jgi:lincosamide and streptogramin A transport system ATP-binding/permease protein